MKTHIIFTPTKEGIGFLQEKLTPTVELTYGDEIPEPADYEILVAGTPSQELLEVSPYLKYLIIPWAGLSTATRELMLKFPQVAVHNLHHNAHPTAEMALALLFAAAKFIIPYDKALRSHDWRPRYGPNPSKLLYGKTALILGYGSIGKIVGHVLQALGMNVLGIQRKPDSNLDDGAEIFGLESLNILLPRAEVLVVALPGTPETEGMLGEEELGLMPSGSVLVNIGRGPIIRAEALFNALRNGHLRGAGIDVWYNYPSDSDSRANTPPADFPFHELENVVMSPHRGGGSEDSERLRMEHLAILLNAAARGEALPNRVDLVAGY